VIEVGGQNGVVQNE